MFILIRKTILLSVYRLVVISMTSFVFLCCNFIFILHSTCPLYICTSFMHAKGDLFEVTRLHVLDISVGVEYSVSADMRELTVLDTEKPSSSRAGSTGSYQCVSSNSEGMIFKDAFLAVLGKFNKSIKNESALKNMGQNKSYKQKLMIAWCCKNDIVLKMFLRLDFMWWCKCVVKLVKSTKWSCLHFI